MKTIRIKGDYACFTRPEYKGERVSYPFITPSAVCGILESILWKPAIGWYVIEIIVCSPIGDTMRIKRNEVKGKPSFYSFQPVDIQKARSQRYSTVLRNVDYVVKADMFLTDVGKKQGDNIGKYLSIFDRRMSKHQCFCPPCLGIREFDASVTSGPGDAKPIPVSKDFGSMLHWIERKEKEENVAHFFHAVMENGVVKVPPFFPKGGENA